MMRTGNESDSSSPIPSHFQVSRDASSAYRMYPATRTVRVGEVVIGGFDPVFIAGPCAVEDRLQTIELAHAVKNAGADLLRGGAYKPRTSPYDFQGLGDAGLDILVEASEATGLPIVTEVMDTRDVARVADIADMIQIGARFMHNTPLLREVGRAGKPVLLKRGWAATIEEWLCAAEYIAMEGNLDIVLCERGIRTFVADHRNPTLLDVAAIEEARRATFLPVIADPSHAGRISERVPPLCRAAMAAGAQGLMIEVIGEYTDPDRVMCDGHQAIRPSELEDVIYETVMSSTRWMDVIASDPNG